MVIKNPALEIVDDDPFRHDALNFEILQGSIQRDYYYLLNYLVKKIEISERFIA